jgi:hypothetical protein
MMPILPAKLAREASRSALKNRIFPVYWPTIQAAERFLERLAHFIRKLLQPDNNEENCMTNGAHTSEATGLNGATSESSSGAKAEYPGVPLPKPTFSTFVLSLASSALVQLGEVPEPATGKVEENIPLAKHSIDILSMLQIKTEKGLDGDEKRLLDGLLYELRMKYVVKK